LLTVSFELHIMSFILLLLSHRKLPSLLSHLSSKTQWATYLEPKSQTSAPSPTHTSTRTLNLNLNISFFLSLSLFYNCPNFLIAVAASPNRANKAASSLCFFTSLSSSAFTNCSFASSIRESTIFNVPDATLFATD